MKIVAPVGPALSFEALFGKSQTYILRALAAKARNEMNEYQLWASLAMELLGKAALAKIHPCLVADPTSSVSLFAAAGMNVGTDIKTIIAKTLFERLAHLTTRFDINTQVFCTNMSLKRNAELHSGEMPFEGVILSTWEGRFWHTTEIVLEAAGTTVEEWLGADQSKAPKGLMAEYIHAIKELAKIKVQTAAEDFAKKSRSKREATQSVADKTKPWEMRRAFRLMADEIWPTVCPACKSKSFLAGIKFNEEISDEQDYESDEEVVDIFYVAEEFRCPACGLNLDNREAITAAGIEVDHTVTDTRQREYEPEYGND